MSNLAVARLLILTLLVNIVWRWVGPGTPILRSLLIALACVVFGGVIFLFFGG